MKSAKLTLPYPPTVNNYWRSWRGRVVLCKAGRAYRKNVEAVVVDERCPHLSGPISISIEAYPPDRRIRDIDNILKAVLDALGHAGLYDDDSQVTLLSVLKGESRPPGSIVVWANEQMDQSFPEASR